jgi:NAD(P)-dependent dehydrogenase (short-subunit alcohol dehydrogenase family)
VYGRTQERVDAATAAIRPHSAAARVDGIAADFSGSAGAAAVIAKLPAVDVPVNNVGIFEPKPFAEIFLIDHVFYRQDDEVHAFEGELLLFPV